MPGTARNIDDRVDTAERMAKALEMRKTGASYVQIAAKLGFAGRQGAHTAVQRAIAGITKEPAKEVLLIELERLDRIFLGLAAKGAFHGKPAAVLAALRVMERRAKYLGLDSPTKLNLGVPTDGDGANVHDDLLGRIARLAAAASAAAGDPKPDA